MQLKNTDDLKQELMEESDLDRFLDKNKDSFIEPVVQQLLAEMIGQKGVSKAVLAKQAGMSEVYLHQVFAGKRNPSRNRLICLCFGMNATLDESQRLLRLSGYSQLFPHKKRDAVIMYGLAHSMTLFQVNDKLYAEDEETLN